MTSKYTPGPWEPYGDAVFSKSTDIPDGRVFGYGFGDNGFICDLDDGEYHEYSDQEEMEANARLIAAAPDLLEALQALYDEQNDAPLERHREDWERAMQMAQRAIAKARGENHDQ